jgi:hypothetical protein
MSNNKLSNQSLSLKDKIEGDEIICNPYGSLICVANPVNLIILTRDFSHKIEQDTTIPGGMCL